MRRSAAGCGAAGHAPDRTILNFRLRLSRIAAKPFESGCTSPCTRSPRFAGGSGEEGHFARTCVLAAEIAEATDAGTKSEMVNRPARNTTLYQSAAMG